MEIDITVKAVDGKLYPHVLMYTEHLYIDEYVNLQHVHRSSLSPVNIHIAGMTMY